MIDYLEGMLIETYPDQVEITTEESSCNEEEEDELQEEDLDNKYKEKPNSYSSALTTMDWGLRSHVDYQEDYWIGDSGPSSHRVGDNKDLFAKTPIQGKVNAANGTSMPMVCKGKMSVEAIPKQGKSSKGVLTIKVAKGMLHKLYSFTTALLQDWKMYGTKKENGDIEIKLTHEHFEPIVFNVLRFNDALSLAAKIYILPRNSNQEGAHTATLEE